MKFKALLLSFLILAPLLIAAPMLTKVAEADVNGPVLWVNPKNTNVTAPCLVSTTFTVEVKLWNKKDLTGDGVFAYDFYLLWPNGTAFIDQECGALRRSLISLVSKSWVSPWDHYFVIADEFFESGVNYPSPVGYFSHFENGTYWDVLHLAITALDNSTPLTDAQVVVLTLTFHIDCEPIWPKTYVEPFVLKNVTLSDMPDPITGVVVPLGAHEVDSGQLNIFSSEPDVHLGPGQYPDLWWCDYMADSPHTVEFWLSNMTNVYAFGFALVFNDSNKYPDIQSIKFCDAFPPPYEFISTVILYDTPIAGLDTLVVEVRRPCEKPPVTHQPGPAVTIDFYETFDMGIWYWPSFRLGGPYYVIPYKSNTTIYIDWAYTLSKCGCGSGLLYDNTLYSGTYTTAYTNGSIPAIPPVRHTYALNWTAANSTMFNYFRPCIADLNLDGVVDIQDLQALAKIYGLDTTNMFIYTYEDGTFTWGNLDGRDGAGPFIVDIFDFVVIAKYFGKPCVTCDAKSIADP
jgi:hypothetical protein